MIRRNVEIHLLLVRGYEFGYIKVLDRLMIAGPHLQHFAVLIFVFIPLPDFDDLFRVRAGGSFNDTQEPIGLLIIRPNIPAAMFKELRVERGLPFGLPEVVPGFVVFDLFGRFEEGIFSIHLAELHQSFGPFNTYFMKEVGLVQEDMRERKRDSHLSGLLEKVGRVGNPVAGVNDLRA